MWVSLGEGREECDELFWSPVPFMAMDVKEPKNPRYTLFVWGRGDLVLHKPCGVTETFGSEA